MSGGRRGLTLIEVVLSMGLLAIGVIALAMTLPAALRVQERARFQLYAATKAMDLVDRFLGDAAGTTPPFTDAGDNGSNDWRMDRWGRVGYVLEASRPWDNPAGRRIFDMDLELRTVTQRGALIKLPRDLAYRIDSAGDAIRHHLDSGGDLYYANPTSANAIRPDSSLLPRPPDESMRLLVAVMGHAQHNAIQHYPWKGWPYYAPYPSPPLHDKQTSSTSLMRLEMDDVRSTIDPEIVPLWRFDLRSADGTIDYDGNGSYISGVRNYVWTNETVMANGGWLMAKSQVMLALWYGWRKGLPASVLYGRPTAADIATCAADPAKVRALRYLAYAAACLTRWYGLDADAARGPASFPWTTYQYNDSHGSWGNATGTVMKDVDGRPAHDGLRQGILIPGDDDPALSPTLGRILPTAPYPDLAGIIALLPNGTEAHPFTAALMDPPPAGHPSTAPARSGNFTWTGSGHGHLVVTAEMIARWHEACLATAMAHATTDPYNWSEPRPYNRPLFTDHPLIQWDLAEGQSANLLTGIIQGTAADGNLGANTNIRARMWRPIAARPITNQGNNRVGTNLAADPDADYARIKGDESRFNLALPFDASERTRQLVFFMVDWTAWRDWETARSAPQDASRYPRWDYDWAVNNVGTPLARPATTFTGFMGLRGGLFEQYTPFFRNPEKSRAFILDLTDEPTGISAIYYTSGPDGAHDVNQTESGAYMFRRFTPYSDARADIGFSMSSNYLQNDPQRAARPTDLPRRVFSGLYGADRNGNARLDRGPLPPSVRLRAVEVCRLNYYDPRLSLTLR